MTKLERRDRRRARAVWKQIRGGDYVTGEASSGISWIASALRREREDAGFAAVNYLFARKADRAKATAAILGTEKGKR